jgi:hypothetical protein
VSEVKLGKFNPRRGCEGPEEEEWYSSTLSLISAIDWSEWLKPSPGRFTPGKKDTILIL